MAKKIKILTNRDKELITGMGRTSFITKQQAMDYLGYNADGKRIKTLISSKIIKSEFANTGNKYETGYVLTAKGRDLAKEFGVSKIYKGASPQHDKCLTDLYYTTYRDYRDTWQTESDWKSNGNIGAPDATVCINGQTLAIEVITDAYGRAEIQAKEEFAQNNDMEVRFHHV